jgi:GDPmannose 4,6-dehydratase
MKKKALITGVSGQDGSYLAKFLLSKNYIVIGTDRRSSRNDFWRLQFLDISKKIIYEELELSEMNEIIRIFNKYDFDEVYNLAAQSFVATSFNSPLETSNINALGPLRILEVIRNQKRKIKFYQASSSEMFGKVLSTPQDEKTIFNPQSPYAISKVFSHYITKNYRESYNIYAVSGICFNHESPLRGEEFITRKITNGISKISTGQLECLEIGNIYAKRDWGFAGEYVEMMWKMMQQKKPQDFIISTGKNYSVKYFIEECLKHVNIKYFWSGSGLKKKLINKANNKVIVKINPKYFRPSEVHSLLGNPKKATKILKWKPKVSFKELIKIMMDADLKRAKSKIES